MELVIELIIIFAVMYVALLILVGRGPKKRHKSDWVSKANYDKFLETGDRNYPLQSATKFLYKISSRLVSETLLRIGVDTNKEGES